MSYFTFSCPTCANALEVPVEEAGMLADCPECGNEITIPTHTQPTKRKIKSSGRSRQRMRSSARRGGSPATGSAQAPAAVGTGNMHLVKDKVAVAVRQHLRGDAPQSLVMGWTGVGLLLTILLGKFSKFFRKYYVIVIGENGVYMLQKSPSMFSVKIKSCMLISWNRIQGASFKDGMLSTYLTLTVDGRETRYNDVESSLLASFSQNLSAYGVPVIKR